MDERRDEGPRRYELGYRPALDGLRGIAILAVIAFHGWFLDGGFFGVDLFFVLSGALITMILAREQADRGSIDLVRFYKRRAVRLVPALAFMVAVGYAWCAATGHPYRDGYAAKALIAMFYVMNVYLAFVAKNAEAGDPFVHTWSLALEEQFYLVWPAVLPRILARSRRKVIGTLLAAMAVVALLRALEWQLGHRRAAYLGPLERADGLIAGCIVGLLTTWGASERLLALNRRLVVLSALVLCVAFVVARTSHAPVYLGGFTLVNLAAASVVLHVLHHRTKALEARPLVWIGKISYSLYVFNDAIRMAVVPLLDWPWLMLVQVALTFACGIVTHYLIERPLLRLRDRTAVAR